MAIVFNPFTGNFDFTGSSSSASAGENFSLTVVVDGETKEVNANREMVHAKDLIVDGTLMVSGDTFQIPDYSKLSFSWSNIPVTESIRIPKDRVLLYFGAFMVSGTLLVEGDLIGVG